MAGITNDVPAGARMLGVPATAEREQKLRLATIAKLPEMRKKLNQLERLLAELRDGFSPAQSGRRLKRAPKGRPRNGASALASCSSDAADNPHFSPQDRIDCRLGALSPGRRRGSALARVRDVLLGNQRPCRPVDPRPGH